MVVELDNSVYTNGHTNGQTSLKKIHQKDVDGFGTRAIHVGSEPDPSTGAVIPALSLSTTYAQDGVGNHKVSFSRLWQLVLHIARSILGKWVLPSENPVSHSAECMGRVVMFVDSSKAAAASVTSDANAVYRVVHKCRLVLSQVLQFLED